MENYWLESLSFKIQQKKNEWLSFIQEATKLKTINFCLEIGCYDGGTTVFLSNVCKNLITIDQPSPARFDQYQYKHGSTDKFGTQYIQQKCNFVYISGNSHLHTTFEAVKENLKNNKLDLLFIDGDHSYNGVKADFETYSNLVADDGYIAFHDIHESKFHEQHGCYVHNFWKELANVYSKDQMLTFYDSEPSNSEWGGIGLIKKKI